MKSYDDRIVILLTEKEAKDILRGDTEELVRSIKAAGVNAGPGYCVVPMPLRDSGNESLPPFEPEVTSRFRTNNPDRPGHDGIDLFYERIDKVDDIIPVRNGHGAKRWVVPLGTPALSSKTGTVSKVGRIRTGLRVWVNHLDGHRTGYFHLSEVLVEVGDMVCTGHPIGIVGAGPSSPRHLHFEVSPIEKYAPIDPEKWLIDNGANVLPWPKIG